MAGNHTPVQIRGNPLKGVADVRRRNRTARRHEACGPPGGLFGIDQEVVTLRGLFGNSGFLTDLRQAESILTHRLVCGL